MRLRYAVLVLLVAAAGAWAAYMGVLHTLSSPGPLAGKKIVYVKPNSSTGEIAEMLFSEGAIDSPALFAFAARREPGVLKAGEYEIPAHASLLDVAGIVKSGKSYQRHLTVAEGLTSAEIVDIVNNAEALEGKVETVPAEGTLLPETYNYTRGEDRGKLIARMEKKMQATLDELWPRRAEGLQLKSPAEAVTLASIVEKETGIAAERPRIAGVFYNRLKMGMALQSDPTVIYALTSGKGKLGRTLTHEDMGFASPYNTYKNAGLPPGPVANPGRAALEAVLNPEDNDYIYFVADGSGGHAFSRSLDEHNRNVARWRDHQRQVQ